MKINLYILSIFFTTTIFSQNLVETKIDKKIIKIGAQFNLTLKTTVDTLSTVVFPSTKSFGKLEVIRNYVIDTVRKDDKYDLIKRYGLTQFDSGRYVIPKMTVLINKKSYLSDTISVDVKDVLVDTLKQKMYDIKPISQVENASSNWWKYVFGLIFFIGIGFLIYFFTKKYQKKKIEEVVYKTPIEKAIGMLKILETKQLWQKGEIKNYYSELTDIARDYIEEVIEIPAKESTTSELIAGLRKASTDKKLKFTKQSLSNLENVLRQADLVKFAKVEPNQTAIEEDFKRIEKSIISLHQSIPTEEIEDENAEFDAEIKRKNVLKKQKKKRITLVIILTLFLLSATTMYFILIKGFSYVKDSIIGHPTKELLESNWITSDYGNPNVTISTPKVLNRLDSKKIFPKSGFSYIKDLNVFAFGNIYDEFSVSLTIYEAKQEVTSGFDGSDKLALQLLEGLDFKNITVKQKDIETKEGVKGVNIYGSASRLDLIKKIPYKFYYEILFFGENNAVQQILIIHKLGDTYSKQIIDRIKNSIELKAATK